MDPKPHAHMSPTHAIVIIALVVFVLGTTHLLAIGSPDSRVARAWLALGL